jgi:hypothetical protein
MPPIPSWRAEEHVPSTFNSRKSSVDNGGFPTAKYEWATPGYATEIENTQRISKIIFL